MQKEYDLRDLPDNLYEDITEISVGIIKLKTEKLSQQESINILNIVSMNITRLKEDFDLFGQSLGFEFVLTDPKYMTIDVTDDENFVS